MRGPSHGWRVVGVCFVAAVFTWGLAVFGNSVYLSEVTKARGWSVALVSASITTFHLTAAFVLPVVGAAVDRHGARSVIAVGAVLLGLTVAAVGQVTAPWQLLAAFICMGLGYSTMSVTGLSATIAPWFDRHGIAGTVIQVASAFGPALYGAARDALGGYPPVLGMAAGLEVPALAVVLAGRLRRGPDQRPRRA